MLASNLPLTYGLVTAACTYEGENTVLLLQTARVCGALPAARLHAREQPAADVRARHRRLHLRGREHRSELLTGVEGGATPARGPHWYEELLTKLRPNAVGLVDSFDIRDE
ncbi:putative peroxisomal acyl-coenzyme A oxidase 1-like protein, partial [Operophtera brumata]